MGLLALSPIRIGQRRFRFTHMTPKRCAIERHHLLVDTDLCLTVGCETAVPSWQKEIKNATLRTIPLALFFGRTHRGVLLHHREPSACCYALPSSEVSSLQVPSAGKSPDFRPCRLDPSFFRSQRITDRALVTIGASGVISRRRRPVAFRGLGIDPLSAGFVRSAASSLGHALGRLLLAQAVIGAILYFLGQAGLPRSRAPMTVLVSMGVITYFIPYLYLFASMFKLQRDTCRGRSNSSALAESRWPMRSYESWAS